MPATVTIWLSASRPKTLAAALAPVAVGAAFALRTGEPLLWAALMPALAFALLVQIGTNFANDYSDFVRGADRPDRRGPTRAVASGAISPQAMQRAAALVFALAMLAGLPLAYWRGWGLLPLGMLCCLAGYAYTAGPFPLAYHGLGDVFVVLFFGLVAVGGSTFVLSGQLTVASLAAGSGVGLLATNILVVNNYRDMETDAPAGKRTLVVRFGRSFARRQFAGQAVVAFAVVTGLALAARDAWLLLPWLAAPLAFASWRRLSPEATGAELNRLLGQAAGTLLLYAALLAVGAALS
jgi:1,4-dihydroxy-2-naphthoate polyprenyltransferase